MSISTILFDFGGVLYTPFDAYEVAARRDELARQLGFADGNTMWRRFYRGREWQATKTGRMTDAEMWDALLSPAGLTTQKEQELFVSQLFAGEGVKPDMSQLVAELGELYRLAILSNASDRLEEMLKAQQGIDRYFDVIVNSHRIGFAKPDEESYRIALAQLQVDPGQVFFIDDQLRNTHAAETLGIPSYAFTSISELRAELRRRSLL